MNSYDDDPWTLLHEEFDAWRDRDVPAELWWRDDDAIAPGPKLEQLIEVSADAGLLIAVIPAKCDSALPSMLSQSALVRVAQHGYAHVNHAPRGQGLGAWELGLHRGVDVVLTELDSGRDQLETFFGSHFLPVIVPPWNRIDPLLYEPLASRGYRAVSKFGARSSIHLAKGLDAVNAHCDPIRWKMGAKFGGELKTIKQLLEHLAAKRNGMVDAAEPTGYLTHHIDLDDEGWEFSQRLADTVKQHPGARWVSPSVVFKGTI
jgi:hypothetical protein